MSVRIALIFAMPSGALASILRQCKRDNLRVSGYATCKQLDLFDPEAATS
jgi:hypothetical protein